MGGWFFKFFVFFSLAGGFWFVTCGLFCCFFFVFGVFFFWVGFFFFFLFGFYLVFVLGG
ncbi:hypothetical protein [Stenotrophomonas maltophilia]|uniref:hypothetical protein n=1 Tax=Stenotrophomonas maltophilia TaxID=40324 RepID=UPI0034E26CB6